ncbi:MAG: septum formation protein [Candidatus Krumholzibacteriia bacterium]|jgi:septum formation protein
MNNISPPVTPFVPWPPGTKLILASRSPRRSELLATAGIPFECEPAGDIESELAAQLLAAKTSPGQYVEQLALAKAADVAARNGGRLVLGADTVVVLDGDILEKPVDEAEARQLLRRLSGRRHIVLTAIALIGGPAGEAGIAEHEATEVDFLSLTDQVIADYVATGEPMDKAGAYGIQGYGALMVSGVQGCYFNVMGLPLARLGTLLRRVLSE